ncbi:MAG: FG-GAP repeat domain-containing protein, partial [Deltaproteobacteria bacterium]
LADLNGDGKVDLVQTDLVNGLVVVWLGNGSGAFQKLGAWQAGSGPGAVVAADFDQDGRLDIATVDEGSGGNGGRSIAVLLGNGDGTLQAPLEYAVGGTPAALAVGDFNGDGKPDLAVTDSAGEVDILLNNWK